MHIGTNMNTIRNMWGVHITPDSSLPRLGAGFQLTAQPNPLFFTKLDGASRELLAKWSLVGLCLAVCLWCPCV